jgi:hypothetical protein
MDQELLLNLIKGFAPTEQELYNELYEMCDREHSGCNENCLVYEINGYKIPLITDECMCFKNGRKMFNFIKERL